MKSEVLPLKKGLKENTRAGSVPAVFSSGAVRQGYKEELYFKA